MNFPSGVSMEKSYSHGLCGNVDWFNLQEVHLVNVYKKITLNSQILLLGVYPK